jgi:hypothetical protein
VLGELAAELDPGLAGLGLGDGALPGIGAITLLLNGQPVALPGGLGTPALPGTLYLIPPILGG